MGLEFGKVGLTCWSTTEIAHETKIATMWLGIFFNEILFQFAVVVKSG